MNPSRTDSGIQAKGRALSEMYMAVGTISMRQWLFIYCMLRLKTKKSQVFTCGPAPIKILKSMRPSGTRAGHSVRRLNKYAIGELLMSPETIVIGCDHAAYQLKEILKTHLIKRGLEVEDVGAFGPESVDYPNIGIEVAAKVSQGSCARGILLCGTGLGMSMVANRFAHVRAALCNDLFSAAMSRKHNDANILVMGGRVVGDVLALEILKTWLETPFEGDRHQRRLALFDNLSAK